jgi:hypothetical protein
LLRGITSEEQEGIKLGQCATSESRSTTRKIDKYKDTVVWTQVTHGQELGSFESIKNEDVSK